MIRINLLPRLPRRRVPGRAIFQVGIPVAVAVVLVLFYLAQAAQVRSLQDAVADLQQRADELRPQVTAVEQLRRQIQEARRKEDLLARLLATQLPASSILANLRVLIPQDAWVTGLNVPDTASFTLDGMAMSYVTVARLIENLEASRLFENVDLNVAERDRVGETEVVKFQVVGRLVRPAATPEGAR